MKCLVSPYNDTLFNKQLYKYCKTLLKKHAYHIKDNHEYEFDNNKYSVADVIDTLSIKGRTIYYSNRNLINYIVYDLSQRFWYTVLRDVMNIVSKLYLEYRGKLDKEKEEISASQKHILH